MVGLRNPLPLLAAIALAGAALGLASAPARGQLQVEDTDSLGMVVNKLYLDLSGIMRAPDAPDPSSPLWVRTLSPETGALYERASLQAGRTDGRVFDYDWLCQCSNTRRFTVPVGSMIERQTASRAEVEVSLSFPAGEVRQVRLVMVNSGGWKIDEIVSESGRRFTEQLARIAARRD